MSTDGPGTNGNGPRRPDALPRLDGYDLLGEVGRGEIGVVYKARQRASGRLVAIKVVHRELLPAGTSERARKADDRFESELQAAATLKHEHLVPVLEVGRCDGRPYCVMACVEGGDLGEALRDGPLPYRRAAAYVEAVARAVHHAHMHGLVHRDLKPRSVLIDGDDRPLVADFGLTGWLRGGAQPGPVPGTPDFAAPEQARDAAWAETPADVYALGATLYHALTGRPPFQSADPVETLRQVRAAEPLPPRRLNPAVDPELQIICLKCLEKSPGRRYDSAADLADDLRRYLDGEPIRARGPGRLARLGRWAGRHPAATALTLALAFLLLACGAVTVLGASRARFERERAVRMARLEEERARAALDAELGARQLADVERRGQDRGGRTLAARTLRLADAEWHAGQPDRARELLDDVPAALRGWEWNFLKRRFAGGQVTLHGHVGPVLAVAYSPDGGRLASAGGDGALRVWDVGTGAELFSRRAHVGGALAAAYSPDGRRLATAGADGAVSVWNARTGEALSVLTREARGAAAVAFSPDGKLLASADADGAVRLWDWEKRAERRALRGHAGAVLALAFGPDGRLASAGADRTVRVWDVAAGKELFALKGHSAAVRAVAFSLDGTRLASGGADRVVRLWNAAAGAKPLALEGHTADVSAVAFSPDGTRLASAGDDRTIRVWDAHTGAALFTLQGHQEGVNRLAFSPDGLHLASASSDGAVKLWDARGEAALPFAGEAGALMRLAVAPNGRLAAAGRDGTVLLWDAARTEPLRLRGHQGPALAVALSADSRLLASGGADGMVRVWDATTGNAGAVFRGHAGPVTAVAFAPNLGFPVVFSAGADRTIRTWPLAANGQPSTRHGHTDAVHALAVRPDGSHLASGGADGSLKVWDANGDRVLLNLAGHVGEVTALAYSPDGQRLASAGADETVRVWGADNGAALLILRGHTGAVSSVAFSPDGRRLVSGGEDRTIRVWDAQTGDELLTLAGHAGAVTSVAFGGDGRRLASAGADGFVRLWDGRESANVSRFRGHVLAVHCVAFSPDGLRLASGGRDRTVRVWDVLTGTALLTLRNRGPVTELAFSADGQQLLGRDDSGRAVGWDMSTGRPLAVPQPPPSSPGPAAASPDGRRLAFAGRDGAVRVIERTAPGPEELSARAAFARPDPAWHAAEAARNEGLGRWFAAGFHLDRLLAARPGDAAALLRRGRARAELGRRDEARADIAAALPRLVVPWPGP